MSEHFQKVCRNCGTVVVQCRCMDSNKAIIYCTCDKCKKEITTIFDIAEKEKLNPGIIKEFWPDPTKEQLVTPLFNAIWEVIKKWDIGLPQDIDETGHQLYSGATGNHVVAIMQAIEKVDSNIDVILPSEVLFGFCAYITGRTEILTVGGIAEVPPILELLTKFIEVNGWQDPREGFNKRFVIPNDEDNENVTNIETCNCNRDGGDCGKE